MEKKCKKWMLFIFWSLLLVILTSCSSRSSSSTMLSKEEPLILLHGTPSDNSAWNTLICTLKEGKGIVIEPVVTIEKTGKLSVDGEWKDGKYPIIPLCFKDNTTETHWGDYLSKVLKFLKHKGYQTANFLGHSSGGVGIALYLAENQYKDKGKAVTLNKVMTLGAPFNGVKVSDNQAGEMKETEFYRRIKKGFRKHQPQIKEWFNIAGDLGENSDQIVPVQSVKCLSNILNKKSLIYHFKILKSHNHTDLHESNSACKMIQKYFYPNFIKIQNYEEIEEKDLKNN